MFFLFYFCHKESDNRKPLNSLLVFFLHLFKCFSFTNTWEQKSYRKSPGDSCTAYRYARLYARRTALPRHTAMIETTQIHENADTGCRLIFLVKPEQYFQKFNLRVCFDFQVQKLIIKSSKRGKTLLVQPVSCMLWDNISKNYNFLHISRYYKFWENYKNRDEF